MPAPNPTCFHLSASSIGSFKACPTRFRLNYREGLRPAADTDSQRMGTNWHAMHEVYADALASARATGSADDVVKNAALAEVVYHLNERYAKMPNTKTPFEWALERQILLTSFIGYQWYWQEDPIEFLASEVAFELPVHMPRTGLPLPTADALRVGKIDHVIRWQGMVGNMERKSTTRSIDGDSDYWDKAKKDTQVSMYALAFRDMRAHGLEHYGLGAIDPGERFGNTLYDVWHKPTIKPAWLSQKDTVEAYQKGSYYGEAFNIVLNGNPGDAGFGVTVDGELTECEIGKKGFSIKETVGMYGARLLADIYERPEFYFARREIARTDAEIKKFRHELFNIYQAQKMYSKTGYWFENEQQCRATFPCPFIPICYGPGADAVCDGKTTPPNFKRIFVDLKVHGEPIAEE